MNRRRDLAELAAGLLVIAAVFLTAHLLVSPATQRLYFGLPTGAVWSNLLASLICVGIAWWRIRARMIAHHAQALTQAARHHREHLEQAQDHHAALIAQGDRHHREQASQIAAQGSHALAEAADRHDAALDLAAAQHKLLAAQADRQHEELTARIDAMPKAEAAPRPARPAKPDGPGPGQALTNALRPRAGRGKT